MSSEMRYASLVLAAVCVPTGALAIYNGINEGVIPKWVFRVAIAAIAVALSWFIIAWSRSR